MLGRNAALGLRLRSRTLRPIADEFGPKVAEVDEVAANPDACRPTPRNAPHSSDSQGGSA